MSQRTEPLDPAVMEARHLKANVRACIREAGMSMASHCRDAAHDYRPAERAALDAADALAALVERVVGERDDYRMRWESAEVSAKRNGEERDVAVRERAVLLATKWP